MNEELKKIQQRLLDFGYSLPKYGADGYAGKETAAAISAYQKNNGIPVTGVLDDATRNAIMGVCAVQTLSAKGVELLMAREANMLTAYRDKGGILTIGVGHTTAAGPPTVTPGMTITKEQSAEIFARDIKKFEGYVLDAVKVPLTDYEFDALVSFVFNIGGGAFKSSTLLKMLNSGDRAGAAAQFLRWNKVKGRVVNGLTNRRKAERKQFLGE